MIDLCSKNMPSNGFSGVREKKVLILFILHKTSSESSPRGQEEDPNKKLQAWGEEELK